MNIIGQFLKEKRESSDITLQQVHEMSGIDITVLSRIENGKKLPTKEQIPLLAKSYSIEEGELRMQLVSDSIVEDIKREKNVGKTLEMVKEKIELGDKYIDNLKLKQRYQLESRRYIGCKAKLSNWIMDLIEKEAPESSTFCDIFAGTAVMSKVAIPHFKEVIVNDLLFSNNIIYRAFFEEGEWNEDKLNDWVTEYNQLDDKEITDNYFSNNYGDKYYEMRVARKIGFIREDIEQRKNLLTEKEYCVLLASLIYSIDRLANTVGHFEAYIKKPIEYRPLLLKLIEAKSYNNVKIYKRDANELAKSVAADVVYIDPPYNSRQYSRFYHLYETLIKWDKPELFGTAMKPKPENMSLYCSSKAVVAFEALIKDIKARYIIVSYNNTYNSKSNSSENKIKLEEIETILKKKGDTKVYNQDFNAFNAGKTDLKGHKEYLFITKCNGK